MGNSTSLSQTVILCHISADVLNSWELAARDNYPLIPGSEIPQLIAKFCEQINQFQLPVFLSFETENEITKNIESNLSAAVTRTTYRHEISIIKEIYSNKEIAHIYYVDSIYSLMDVSLVRELFSIHHDYSADYSYIENTPPGISGVFIHRSLFDMMKIDSSEKSGEIDPDIPDSLPVSLSAYVEKNINHFHVEIHYQHPDMRIMRLDFSGKTPRSILRQIRAISLADKPYEKLKKFYNDHPENLRSFPSYFEVEIHSDCDYACTFCPRQFVDQYPSESMTPETLQKLLDYAKTGHGDSTFCIGGMGEPLQNEQAGEILSSILDSNDIPMVILETNGYHLNQIHKLAGHPALNKLRIVVNISSLQNYAAVHGCSDDAFNHVRSELKKWSDIIKEKQPDCLSNTYIQTLKITENETEIDSINALADELGFSFLLEKYNTYAGLMPEKRVSDMTPLERSFCWHLRRDLYVRANGDVAFCMQDFKANQSRGNITETPINEIWDAGSSDWKNNFTNNLSSKPDCNTCDEYYTFNM